MTLYRRAVGAFALAATLATFPQTAAAQRGDSFSWKLGVQGGSMIFQTQTEDTELVPSGGAHFLIMARRSGLMVGIDEGFGTDQRSGLVLFNDLRRYQAVMMAYPVSLPLGPYFGAGGVFEYNGGDHTGLDERAMVMVEVRDGSWALGR